MKASARSIRFIVLIGITVLPEFAFSQSPTITSISPSSGVVGMQVQIAGTGFGASQGNSTVELNGTTAAATNWSNSGIAVIVPSGATSGSFSVTVNGESAYSSSFTVTSLPSGWSDTDIGSVGLAGSSSYGNGVFTVKGAGSGFGGTADSLHFVYQPVSGNGSIVARVASLSTGAMAGIMLRSTTSSGSIDAYTAYGSSGGYVYFYDRTTTGGSTSLQNDVSGLALPYWVELVVNGSTVTSYTSPDGVNWTQLGSSVTVNLGTNMEVGLAVTSQSTSSLATATFDNVSLNTAASPAPVISSVSATTGSVGSQVVITGSNFGASQGGGVVTLNAMPLTVNSWSATSITITISTGATTGYLVVSVAPDMDDSNPVWFTVTSQPLPSGWLDQDVGIVGKTGSAGYANGVFTINGAGSGFGGTADSLHFVYQPVTGNGSIVARVASLSTGAAAGVMVRSTLAPGSIEAYTDYASSGGYVYFYDRTTTGGSTSFQNYVSGFTLPYWVQLVVNGSTVTSYISPDGVNWTQLGSSATVNLGTNIEVGLAVTSQSTSSLATATFDNVSLNTAASPAPVISSVSATTGSVGSQVVISGSNFGASQGSSEVMLNDAPVTVNYWSSALLLITIPTGATTGSLVVSVAPSMDDSNPVWFTVTSQPLPSPWLDQDVGIVGKTGSAGYANGVFTINGAGSGFGGTADSLHFVYQPVTGNGSIVARVASLSTGAAAGVMVRSTLAPGSIEAYTDYASSGGYVYFYDRTTTGGSTSFQNYVSGLTLPYWVKLVVNGSTVTSYISQDGTHWTQLGSSATVNLGTNIEVGLAVTSQSTSSLATATLDNVSSTFVPLTSSPVITAVSPSLAVPGTPVTVSGANFGSTQGTSTITFNGTAGTPTSRSGTSIVVPVPMSATSGNIVVTVGGVATNGMPFTVSQTPTINSLSPTAGPVGTSVTITGVNFGSPQGTSTVTFNGTAATPTNWTSTSIVAPVPSGATTGSVVVTTANGTSSGTLFTVLPVPSITSLSTSSATIGSLVTITGTNFGSIQGTSSVTFNGVTGLPTSWSASSIVVPVPVGATTGNVIVVENGISSNAVALTISLISLPVASVLPASGATAVPENARVIVRFAQSVPQSAIISGTVTLSQGGTNVTGSLGVSDDGLSVTFTPTQTLTANTTFSVAVTDLAGNQTTPEFQSNFTTGSTTDTVTPTALQTSPANNTTGVPISAPIVVQFSKTMDPSTLTAQSFSLVDNVTGQNLPGTVEVDASDTIASFVPQALLAVDRSFSAVLGSAIQDSSGNSFGGNNFGFTTSFAPDATAPQLAGMSPANGATGVPINAVIVVQFSKPLDPINLSNNLQLQLGGQPVSTAMALSNGNQQITFTPLGGLTPNTTYTLVSTAQITDLGGLALSNPGTFSFTTGSVSDATTPSVVSVSPSNSSTGVPVNGIVQIQFSKPVDPFTVTPSTLQISMPVLGLVGGTVSVSSNGLTATFIPNFNLSSYTNYIVQATTGIEDLEGHQLSFFQSSFTTGASTDSSGPSVQMISPENGVSGVPVNVRLDVAVNTPLDPDSVNVSSVVVSAGGSSIPGTVTLSSSGTTLTYVPSTLLSASTTYSVTVSGVTDLAGNAITPFNSSFTTGASGTANTTTPSVTSTSPANGATAVSVNAAIALTFNEPIDITTVSDTTAPISVGGLNGSLAGSYSIDATGTVLTFTPLSPLPANSTIDVQVTSNGVLDLSGNGSSSYTGSFSTGAGTDTTTPTVTLITPTNGSSGNALNTIVVLTFSKSLNPNTVSSNNFGILVNGAPATVGISRSADNRVITLNPYGFPASSTITVVATSGVTDLYGNSLANFQSEFTTGPAPSAIVPVVSSQRPGNSATGVPLNDTIVLYFSQPMNIASLTSAVNVSQNGVLVSGNLQATDNGQVVQFTPSASFQPNSLVQVFVTSTAQNTSGININSYESSFTSAANASSVASTQIASNPAGSSSNVPTNVVIDMAFNGPLDPTSLTATTVLCYQNGNWFQGELSLINGGTVVQVVPRSVLQPNTSTTCQIGTGLKGLNGIAAVGGGINFTTGSGLDTVVPTILTTSPPSGLTNVGDNANVRLTFSEPINPITVNASTIQLTGGGGTVVPDSISFSNNNQMVLLVPHAPLPDNTQMTLTISGITDVAGNPVAPQTTQFTTGAGPDVTGPLVVWTNPLETNPYQAPANVPLNSVIQVMFNEPVDPGTVNSTTFSISDESNGNNPITGTYSVSSDGLTATFVPSGGLTAGHQYSVSPAHIEDLAGNTTAGAVSPVIELFGFAAGNTASTNAPQVTSTSPANLATGIPINAQIVIGFNEPIDSAKLSGLTVTGPGGLVTTPQTVTNGNQIVALTPIQPLTAATQYTVNIAGVQDYAGNVLSPPATSTFSTSSSADLSSPTVASSSPSSGATGVSTTTTIQAQFSKPVNPLTVLPTTFTAYPNSTQLPVVGTISFSNNGQTITLTPSEPLASLTAYTVQLTSGIIDLEGHSLGNNSSFGFTTGQGSTSLAPVIDALSPSIGTAGSSVDINGSYFGTSQGTSTVTFNGVTAIPTSWSDAQIVVPVPSGATTGPVVVTVNGVASNSTTFTVRVTPSITSISPSSATVGTVLTITGSNFGDSLDSTNVTFSSTVYPYYITSVSPISSTETSITVAVPSSAVTGNVYVQVGSMASNSVSFTVIPTPNITSLSTNSGVPGTPVTVNGTNFGNTQGSSTVSFNGVAAAVTSWTNTSISAVAPGNVTTGPVTVVVNSVASNSNVIFTVATPTIASLSPPSGAVSSTVIIAGAGLTAQGLSTEVTFNGIAASISNSSANSITVNVPSNATTGPVVVSVGGVVSNSLNFTVEQAPTITSVSPNVGPYNSYGVVEPITITGSGFGATQSDSTVNFFGSSTPPQITNWSDTSITLYVPDDAATGPLGVQVGGLTGYAPTWFTVSGFTQLTDSLGNQTTYSFSWQGGRWFTSASQGPGCVTCTVRGTNLYTGDSNGNILTATDDLSNTTTYTYDGSNDMTSAAKPLNANNTQITSYTYNSFGEVLTMTDPLGNVTTNTYDVHGNLLTVTTPAPNGNTNPSVTQFQYAPNGELTQITDPKGNVTTLTYTTVGLIASITDAQNNTTSYQYDSRGNRTAVIDPINGPNHPTSFTYDMMNRLTGITYPDGSTAGFTYDVRGRRTSATDQNGKTTTYTYDDADRLTAVTDPANHTIQYAYDTEDNLLSITDANGNMTQFAYNARGWVTQTEFPSTLTESYTYDAVGNLLSKTDRKGNTIQYVYDALYRLSSKTYPDQTSVEYAYDLAGKVLQVSDPTGSYGFAYDNMGRLIGTSTQYAWLPGLNFQNAYTYDAASNRTGLTAPDGSTTTYTYDTLNRLNGQANSWAGTFGFGYDALSRRTSLTRPNGVNTSYSYDGLSHLLSVLHQAGLNTLDGASYTYDPAGNRLSKTNYLSGVTSNYSYDLIYELTQVTQGASTTETYSYDAVGNRLSSLSVPNYSYNVSNELTSNSNGSYTYDANGNTLSDPSGKSYTWDFENRLTQVVVPGTNGGTTTFKYDPFGRRIQKSGPLGTTNYLYDGSNSIEEVDNGGNVLARYARTKNLDEPLSELRSGTTNYYQQDGLGSITSLSSTTGALAESYTYDSYGKVISSTGSLTNPFQYTGRELDSETSLLFNRARYFDPTGGRFVSEDPLRFRGGLNLYAYTRNNPVLRVDPSGYQGCTPAQWAQSPGACAGPQDPDGPYQGPDGLWYNVQTEWQVDSTPLPDEGPTPPPSPAKPGPPCVCDPSSPLYWQRVFKIRKRASDEQWEKIREEILPETIVQAIEKWGPHWAEHVLPWWTDWSILRLEYDLWKMKREADEEIEKECGSQ